MNDNGTYIGNIKERESLQEKEEYLYFGYHEFEMLLGSQLKMSSMLLEIRSGTQDRGKS